MLSCLGREVSRSECQNCNGISCISHGVTTPRSHKADFAPGVTVGVPGSAWSLVLSSLSPYFLWHSLKPGGYVWKEQEIASPSSCPPFDGPLWKAHLAPLEDSFCSLGWRVKVQLLLAFLHSQVLSSRLRNYKFFWKIILPEYWCVLHGFIVCCIKICNQFNIYSYKNYINAYFLSKTIFLSVATAKKNYNTWKTSIAASFRVNLWYLFAYGKHEAVELI